MTCRIEYPAPYTWACGHRTIEPEVPRQWPCPIAQTRNPLALCPNPENVHKLSSRNRIVKCCNYCDHKQPGPKRDGDDTGASGLASSLTMQNQRATVDA